MRTRHATAETDLGELTLVASGDALAGVYFPGHWYLPPEGTIGARVEAVDDPVLDAARIQLEEYLAGERDSFDLPTALAGDPFQERVWALLEQIPRGETTTYGAIAERLGAGTSARAVGRAVGRNPLSIVVPCHRVVGSDGKLTGYAGGLERKRFLLELEEPEPALAGKLF
jgi:methylated-DNA-[protein]-cysteine S-methyltransferase